MARPGRDRLHSLLAREQERFEAAASAVAERSPRGPASTSPAACRCTGWSAGRAASRSSSTDGERRPLRRRRRPRVRRLLPRRHRGDDRPRARRDGRPRSARRLDRGLTLMLPTEDAIGSARSSPAASGCPTGSSRSTATDANRFAIRLARADHRPAEDPRLQLVLPRHRRRDLRDRSSTAASSRAPGQPRAAGRPGADHPGRRVQRRRGARARAGRTATSPASSPSRR